MLDVSRKVVPDKGRLNREQLVTKALKFPSCTKKIQKTNSFELEQRVEEGVHTETWWQTWRQGTITETKNKGSYLENNPFFDWQPVKSLEQWSTMFMPALVKNNSRCAVLNFLQPVHLITVDVNEQGVRVVQPTENKRTHQLSSGFRHQEIAHCQVSACYQSSIVNNQWRSDGAEDGWSWVSSADLWWPHLLWEITS